ncbi:sulfite exporter TauE/SafE family protein [Zooshikella ganghwensis]|uniref:Probable membrane transporter protein n=1 Tax=Zooshikella ganghwensis TaxID=202772 RepID=A0A4V1IN40_9GAMM|nr:sulfite exporter TauE/SafE family protein [Zooshikella ganghwensis]RDH42401.1 sulfite exporter TauE/SafE family protein [Zooshikella ganghwensis]
MLLLGFYLTLGALAGLLAGLFGIGGGLIIVPVLLYSFTFQQISPAVVTHLAIGTSLASIAVTASSSMIAHLSHSLLPWRKFMGLVFGVIVGSALGGWLATFIGGVWLIKGFGAFAMVMAAQMVLSKKKVSDNIAGQLPDLSRQITYGGVIGSISAVFGIGGGTLTVPALRWHNVSMQHAVAIAATCSFPLATVGALSYGWHGWGHEGLPNWSTGYVYWPALLGINATSIWFAKIGAKFAHQLPEDKLQLAFAAVLFLVGIDFLLFT